MQSAAAHRDITTLNYYWQRQREILHYTLSIFILLVLTTTNLLKALLGVISIIFPGSGARRRPCPGGS
jgi:hypothetical protein